MTLYRRDPERRMARFYALRLQPVLSGGIDLIREWGRIGSSGRVRADPMADLSAALDAAEALERAKRRKGYR
jgi:predicted DNA-binding WGR domain protein